MNKKIFSSFLAILLVALCFSSCGETKEGASMLYPIDGNIRTIDPQSASTPDELIVVENTMEGLVRKGENGTIMPALAENWEISEDNLVYTFHLRKGAKWDLNENIKKLMGDEDFNPEITAKDFVFALQRACDSATKAPNFNSISAIVNAISVHNGSAAPDTIGVEAIDDYTLQISLSSPDTQFLVTMGSAIAMPCNQDFFNATGGRYGLKKDTTLFNGPFYLSRWYETSMILRKSAVYDKTKGVHQAKPSKVTLNVPADRSTVLPNLIKGTYDVALITGQESTGITEKSGISLTPYKNTTLSYIFNCADQYFSNEKMRLAFCHAFQNVESGDVSFVSKATGIVPDSCNINSVSYREAVGESSLLQNDERLAEELWLSALKELSPSEMTVTILCTSEYENFVKTSLQGVQASIARQINYVNKNNKTAGLDLSVKVEVLEKSEMDKRISDGLYQIAFYPIQANDDNTKLFLESFAEKPNLMNYYDHDFAKYIKQSETARTVEEAAPLLQKCENILIQKGYIFPVLSQSDFFATAKGVKGVLFTGNGGKIDFVNGVLAK